MVVAKRKRSTASAEESGDVPAAKRRRSASGASEGGAVESAGATAVDSSSSSSSSEDEKEVQVVEGAAVTQGGAEDNSSTDDDSGSGGEDGEDDDEDEDDGDEDDDEEEKPVERKVLPQRSSRGLRVNKLIGEAAEADDAFWGQDAFADDASDTSFSSSDIESSTTSTDSNIDAPEIDEGDEDDKAGPRSALPMGGRGGDIIDDDDERGGRGKRGYVDKGAAKLKGVDMQSLIAGIRARAAKPQAPRSGDAGAGSSVAAAFAPASRSIRSSTLEAHEAAEVRRKEEEAAASQRSAAAAKAAEDKQAAVEPKPTQAQVLVEAAATTIENERVLASLLRQESERRAKDAQEAANRQSGHSFPPGVPLVRYHSKRGLADTITFTETDEFPSIINARAV